MNTKATFEDRLLSELRHEIERREIGRREAGVAEAAPGDAPARVRRLVTRPRIALAAAACGATALAVVLVPGSPAGSTAYAVERHGDGSVTLTLNDLTLQRGAQRELTERLRADGIHVDIQTLDMSHKCEQPRGEDIPGNYDLGQSAKAKDSKSPQDAGKAGPGANDLARSKTWKITLHRGDTLAFENNVLKDGKRPGSGVRSVRFYGVKGTIKPCVPVERPNPIVETG